MSEYQRQKPTYHLEYKTDGGHWKPDRDSRGDITFDTYEEGVAHIECKDPQHACSFRLVCTYEAKPVASDAEIVAHLRARYEDAHNKPIDHNEVMRIIAGDF